MNSPDQTFDLSFRVVIYHEGDEWIAHSLEADIVGCGASKDEAIAALDEALDCQISFAFQMENPSLLEREAPPEVLALWDEAWHETVQSVFAHWAPQREVQPVRADTSSEHAGPLALYHRRSGQELVALRNSRLEPVCG